MSTEEVRLLGSLVDAGRAAGLSEDILGSAQGIADAGDATGTEASGRLVQSLRDACAGSATK